MRFPFESVAILFKLLDYLEKKQKYEYNGSLIWQSYSKGGQMSLMKIYTNGKVITIKFSK